jgi:hypothetical protein
MVRYGDGQYNGHCHPSKRHVQLCTWLSCWISNESNDYGCSQFPAFERQHTHVLLRFVLHELQVNTLLEKMSYFYISSSSFTGFYNPLAGFSLLILEVT